MSYDQSCYDLALSFFEDSLLELRAKSIALFGADLVKADKESNEKLVTQLAQEIQTTIEDFLNDFESKMFKEDDK